MQLAHQERNKVRRSYNHAKYLPQRRAMMQSWADYLDALRASTDLKGINEAGRASVVEAMKTVHLFGWSPLASTAVDEGDCPPETEVVSDAA
ncbi:MAG: hypothetical protein WDO68_22935 [Gammaproteobacteria bacterium]